MKPRPRLVIYAYPYRHNSDPIRREYLSHFSQGEVVALILNGEVVGEASPHVCHRMGVRVTGKYGNEVLGEIKTMTILINGKHAYELDTSDLQKAAYDLLRRAHYQRIKSYADELEQQIKEAWAKYHAEPRARQPDTYDMINEYCDGVCVYNLDIASTLFASDNDTYAYDEGLLESRDDCVAAHYAIVQDVTEELQERGALEEPEPPSEDSDDETNDEGEADTERAPSPFDGGEIEVTGADGVVRKMRAKT